MTPACRRQKPQRSKAGAEQAVVMTGWEASVVSRRMHACACTHLLARPPGPRPTAACTHRQHGPAAPGPRPCLRPCTAAQPPASACAAAGTTQHNNRQSMSTGHADTACSQTHLWVGQAEGQQVLAHGAKHKQQRDVVQPAPATPTTRQQAAEQMVSWRQRQRCGGHCRGSRAGTVMPRGQQRQRQHSCPGCPASAARCHAAP